MSRKSAKGLTRPSKPQQDHVTTLVCAPGRLATKRFVRDNGAVKKIDFDAGYLFSATVFKVAGIEALSAVLTTLESMPNALVIRGVPENDLDLNYRVRRKKVNFPTPALGHRWMLIDIDALKVPTRFSLKHDALAVCEHVVKRLPEEFHHASYHWQLSSSAGVGKRNTVSMHLWFWLSAPVTDAALKTWGKAVNVAAGVKLVDTVLFNDVQPHYTAAPIFEGVKNPFPVRSGLVRKGRDDVVLKLPRASTSGRIASVRAPGSGESDVTGFDAILAQVGDHDGGEGFHSPIIRAVASHVRAHGRDGTDIENLYEIVRARVVAADSSRHEESYVERMASRDHIIPAIQGALEKYGDTSRTLRKSRRIEGLKPHYVTEPAPAAKALATLKKKIDTFFR